MSAHIRRFDEFTTGMHTHFHHTIFEKDFAPFAELSGDRNPLHHDDGYAAGSEFGKPIVPLHLTAAPLSRIAGMLLPGDPSLYLRHELRALKPVFYGDDLCYSARITSVSEAARTLSIRVIVLRKTDVVLEARMTVHCRLSEWPVSDDLAISPAGKKRWGLVTGSTGGIGTAVALRLARSGWNLCLHARADTEHVRRLADDCRREGAEVTIITGALDDPEALARLARTVGDDSRISLLIHTASPTVHAPLRDLVAVNFQALKTLADAMLPGCLQRQQGSLVLLGSAAMIHHPPGWEDYVATKAMATSLIQGLHNTYSPYGVTGLTVAPGFVNTKFSAPFRASGTRVLLPEEVAESIVNCLSLPVSPESFVLLEPGTERAGTFGFTPSRSSSAAEPEHPTRTMREADRRRPDGAVQADTAAPGAVVQASATQDTGPLETFFRKYLGLGRDFDLDRAELGATPGWDSLKHIEMLVELERQFDISFTSQEIEKTVRFPSLSRLWLEKLYKRPNPHTQR